MESSIFQLKSRYRVHFDLSDQYPYLEDGSLNRKRRIYRTGNISTKELFKGIIVSDIGGELDLSSSIFIVDINTGCIFYLYDDRGLYLFATKENSLTDVLKEFCDDIGIDIKMNY